MTRSLGHLVRGNWRESWAYHPLAALVLVEALAVWVVALGVRHGRWSAPRADFVRYALAANVVVLVGVWAWRAATGGFAGLA